MAKKQDVPIVSSGDKPPLPTIGGGNVSNEAVKVDLSPVRQIDKESVLFVLYLMYKTNMLTRLHLKVMFEHINKPVPDNIAKYLVEEAAK